MNLLILENSSSHGSIALVRNGRLVREVFHEAPRGRGAAWFTQLADFADEPVDGLLVGTGPGSYNGLRSAAAAAWGFARARCIPLRGISSLLGYSDSAYAVLGDARAGQWFFAAVRDRQFSHAPALIPADQPLPHHEGPLYTVNAMAGLASAVHQSPSALHLARFWEVAGPAEAIYLKPPHITTPHRPPRGFPAQGTAPGDPPGAIE